jgi:hypothetical protein
MKARPDLERLMESLFELERAAGRLEQDVHALMARSEPGVREQYRATEIADWTDRVEGLAAGLADACADSVEALLAETLHERPAHAAGPTALFDRHMDVATTLTLTTRRSALVVRRAARTRALLGERHPHLEARPLLDASDATRRAEQALERMTSMMDPTVSHASF